jgi:hypothetical protein
MMICRDIRRRWLQYGENRKNAVKYHLDGTPVCDVCDRRIVDEKLDIDHIKPLGPRPRKWEDLGKYAKAMFERKCQALCKICHLQKTRRERK